MNNSHSFTAPLFSLAAFWLGLLAIMLDGLLAGPAGIHAGCPVKATWYNLATPAAINNVIFSRRPPSVSQFLVSGSQVYMPYR